MRIYIDTSVINGLYSNDARIVEISKNFFLYSAHLQTTFYGSDLTAVEIERTPDPKKRKLLIGVIEKYSIELLPMTSEARKLAQKYVEDKIFPSKYLADALHVATATVHNIPILVSWNFAHMVKHRTRVEVNHINQKYGYIQIDICSPEEV